MTAQGTSRFRWLRRALAALLVLIVILIVAAWWMLRGSLPRLEGETALAGLAEPVTVTRDALGTVTINAAGRADAVRALGYVHAQVRYFQMDLMRRTAAGELAALFGPAALALDKAHRVHRFRDRVTQHLSQIAGRRRDVLEAYVAGVNAGLEDLDVRPWPYWLLMAEPEPWQMADSALVGYAMYFDLQDEDNSRELALWRIKSNVPKALFALLTHDGSIWGAPLTGKARGAAALPPESVLNLRRLPAPETTAAASLPPPHFIGSNNFAVAGRLTRHGHALIANDMHLTLRVPNIWFRARLRYPDPRAPGGQVDVTGFTLPGFPGMVVGSNGHVAWGFTNAYGDWLDWKWLPPCDREAPCPGVAVFEERIEVAGAADEVIEVKQTPWGPILHENPDGSRLALRWVAHLPGAMNLGLMAFARAGSVEDVLRMADQVALPAQNLLVGDRDGHIAWRLLGPVPQRGPDCPAAADPVRATHDDARLQDTARCEPWPITTDHDLHLTPLEAGRAWTANNRVVSGEMLARIGNGGYALGARAQQIRNDLFAQTRFDERDLLEIQLDDRAVFLTRWWALLQEFAARYDTPALQALAGAGAQWEGRAIPESVSYRLVRAWRLAVHERIADGLTAPAQAALGDAFEMPPFRQFESVVWPLVTQQPTHLLPKQFDSWQALFGDAAAEVREELEAPLSARTWGERNTADICHPLAAALPEFVAPFLCMPFTPLPGDTHMPRVAAPNEGASERMVVAPGREAQGITHMPGGQSGHPLSPFWGAGHEAWVYGRATGFLPGEAEYRLRLIPGRDLREAP